MANDWWTVAHPALTGGLSAVYTGIDNGDITKDSIMSTLDPGDVFGRQAAKDAKEAAERARQDLLKLSDTAWNRQMQGLQAALGSMNTYAGVLSNLTGLPTNQYDTSLMGGQLGSAPPGGGQAGAPPPGGAFGSPVRPDFQPVPVGAGGGAFGGPVRPNFTPTGTDIRPNFAPIATGPSVETLKGIGHF